MPSENITRLLALLGPGYSARTFDDEECIHRKLNDSYELEISGAWGKGRLMTVYVWELDRKTGAAMHTVEMVCNVREKDLPKVIENLSRSHSGST